MLSASIFKSIFDFRIWIPILYINMIFAVYESGAKIFADTWRVKDYDSKEIFDIWSKTERNTQNLESTSAIDFLFW